jgi:hypothetical protein
MGLGDIFKRKKKDALLEQLPQEIAMQAAKPNISREVSTEENLKAKMDLIATHLESVKVQQAMLNERLERMDKILQEIYMIAKRSS